VTPNRSLTAAASAATTLAPAAPKRQVTLDLRVAMGEKLRVRGRGLDASLRGDLHLTSPGGRLAVDGSLRAVDGTYQAYGQKLGIDRGVLTFVGPIENPRLDIEATRPNLDVRVGSDISTAAGRKALVLSAISEGRARGLGQMPALLYQGKEAEDVADFVAAVAGH